MIGPVAAHPVRQRLKRIAVRLLRSGGNQRRLQADALQQFFDAHMLSDDADRADMTGPCDHHFMGGAAYGVGGAGGEILRNGGDFLFVLQGVKGLEHIPDTRHHAAAAVYVQHDALDGVIGGEAAKLLRQPLI